MRRWYVVQSRSKQEHIAIDNLENQGFNVYCPTVLEEKVHKTSKGREIAQVAVPLFPSYMFVEFDINKDRWRSIASTRGVYQLVGYRDDYVSPLPRMFVEEMKKNDKKGFIDVPGADQTLRDFVVGQELTIKNGVFEGFSGICERVKKDRVVILLSLLSGKTSVELDKTMVSRP